MISILVGCEESQAVCVEFRQLGFNAYSCDVQEPSGGHPEWHIQRDIFEAIDAGVPGTGEKWHCLIAFPDCTYLTSAGIRWFNIDRYGLDAILRHEKRFDASDFVKRIWAQNIRYIAIENPVGFLSKNWMKPSQIIHPWQYGNEASKRTCLWLKKLPLLEPTEIVGKGEFYYMKTGSGKRYPKCMGEGGVKKRPEFMAITKGMSREECKKKRSKTFPGIAKAMAEQWGEFLLEVIK
jgi:site-specific DNA-cytosine methylase